MTTTDIDLAAEAVDALDAITGGGDHEIEVGGRRIKLTNVDKVMYPEVGFTKLDVARYYARVSAVLLPHLRGRALTLKRYPDGVEGSFFYQKRCPEHRPAWISTSAPIGDKQVEYCMLEDVQGLLWTSNLADLELHVPMGRADSPERPAAMVFDLDPGPGTDVVTCADVALELRVLFQQLELESYVKTSGSKGLQLYVPLNRDDVSFDDTKPFAQAVAQLFERQRPELVVSKMQKSLRTGKVLIDWSQNDDSKTTVCVYSLRARPEPTVSTPVTWDEVEGACDSGDAQSLTFTQEQVLKRISEHGDLFAKVETEEQQLRDVVR